MIGRWTAAWVGAAALGVINGTIREAVYRDVGEERAQRISTVTLIAALGANFWALDRRWPIPSTRQALQATT